MKFWVEKSKREKSKQKTKKQDSVANIYKKEILDTRITVSDIARESKNFDAPQSKNTKML